jgi:hypothetical protein
MSGPFDADLERAALTDAERCRAIMAAAAEQIAAELDARARAGGC